MKKLVLVLLAAASLLLTGCQETQEGEKCITLEIVYVDEEAEIDINDTLEVCTDAEYLIEVLEENSDELSVEFAGEDSEWGAYLAGLKGYNFETLGMSYYWSIYVNGDYGMLGISDQPVVDGDMFKFEATSF